MAERTDPGGERALAALQRVTDAALTYLREGDLVATLLQRITEILGADTAAILLLDEGGELLRAHAAKGIEEEVEQGVTIPVGKGFAGRVVAERRPIAIEDVLHADIFNPILREKGIRSLLGVPLLIQGRVLGVLHIGSLTLRHFTDDDRDLLQLAADRAAIAIDRARLLERERGAREAAERATARLEALQRVTDAALAYLPLEELLRELMDRITDVMGTDTAAILLLDESGDLLRARAAKGIEEEVEQGVTIPVGRGFAGRVASQRRAIAIDDVDRADIYNPILREKGIRSLLGVPLIVEGRVLGVLHVGSLTSRRFTVEERDLLQLAGDRAAMAIEHAALYEQRNIAEALQRRLLPDRLENVPGLELATRYLPASGNTLGGDWYDAFRVGTGRIALAVGDVVGHGLAAAAVMAQLRTALRAYAAEGHDPAVVVERVNALMWDLGPAAMTTLVFMVLDPDGETLEVVNAGHPPPLIIRPGAAPEYLPAQGGIALGASPVARYRGDVLPFPTGATVLLFTDGLVEERGRSIDVGLDRLAEASAGPDDVEALCDRVVGALLSDIRPDDVAVIAARMTPPRERLTGTWPADRRVLAGIRQLLRRWLRFQGANPDEVYDLTVAVQEACANAIEHAYRPGAQSFALDASANSGHVRIVVRDHGRWREPRGGRGRGRGLVLMRALTDVTEVLDGEEGTEVVLERSLGSRVAA